MEYYRKVFIKSEEDLPKERYNYYYFVHHVKADNNESAPFNNELKDYWLDHFDWYLQPIEEQPKTELPTDEEINEEAYCWFSEGSEASSYWKSGAKWMRDKFKDK